MTPCPSVDNNACLFQFASNNAYSNFSHAQQDFVGSRNIEASIIEPAEYFKDPNDLFATCSNPMLSVSTDSFAWSHNLPTPAMSPSTPMLSPTSAEMSRDSSIFAWTPSMSNHSQQQFMYAQPPPMAKSQSCFPSSAAFAMETKVTSSDATLDEFSHDLSHRSFSMPVLPEHINSFISPNQSFPVSQQSSCQLSRSSSISTPKHNVSMRSPSLSHPASQKRSNTAHPNPSVKISKPSPQQQASTSAQPQPKLLPKTKSPTTKTAAATLDVNSESMSRKLSDHGKEVVGIPRLDRQASANGSGGRATAHQGLKCPHCNARAKGYRGDHELARHMARAHPGSTRKAWICVDGSPDGKFLSKCKFCIEKKEYGAYYNAAAQ